MLEQYKDVQRNLLNHMDRLKVLAEHRKDQQVSENLMELQKKLIDNRFYLVVVGQFKRGKSTFINSLLGEKLLPTAVVPLTSILTLLRYGDKESIEVIFKDGRRRPIKKEELVDYVTEKGNPKNVKEVAQVEITYPSEYLKQGVHLIDTPGVGSIFADNTEVTYSFLPKMDAALFLLAVDPPISQSELEFLQDVKQYVQKIFFIQNKIDYLSPEERIESMEFSKRVIEESLGDGNITIYPLSAKLALEGKLQNDLEKLKASKLEEFHAILGEFLMREKGKILLRSVFQSASKLLADEIFAVDLERKAIAMPLRDLEAKITLFENQLERIQQEKQDNGYLFEVEIKRVMDFLDRDLDRLRKSEMPKLLEELRKLGEEKTHLSTKRYVEVLQQTLREGIVNTFDEWITCQEERLNEQYSRISKEFSDRTNEIIDNLMVASAKLFDVKLERMHSDEAISSDKRFYYLLGDPPRFFDLTGAVDFFSRTLLPKSLSQHKVLKDLMKKLPERIDANCGRVRADFKRRIQESFLKFRWDLNKKIDATADSIRQALQQAVEMKKESAQDAEERARILQEQSRQLIAIKEDFQKLDNALESL